MLPPDTSFLSFLATFFIIALIYLLTINHTSARRHRRPPGPPGWPLVGNILDVRSMPHQGMYNLKSRYGPVIWLRLGAQNAVVIQSAAAAAELFKKHDLPFADRRVPNSLTACGYNVGSLANARYGSYWRTMRRLCTAELTVQKRINGSTSLRHKCLENMIRWIKEDAASGSGEIQLDQYLCLMSFNFVSSFMLSMEIMDMKSDTGKEFYEAVNLFMEWNGRPNLVDAFPFLKPFDPQGIRRNTEKHLGHLLELVSRFVQDRVRQRKQGGRLENSDFLDALLEYSGEGADYLTDKNIKIIILEMFLAGTETTGSTIQWAMAELLKNPNSLSKLKAELNQITRPVEEKDLGDLKYLQAVVKEVMRLHPSLPLLMPRNATEDTEFMGYVIPKDTIVLVNAWGIHRDPDSWEEPLSFRPERFEKSNVDYKGQCFELIPFGSGRRLCIGIVLGERMVSLSVARLVQEFQWELPAGKSAADLDMREMMGISLRKLEPLKAIPK